MPPDQDRPTQQPPRGRGEASNGQMFRQILIFWDGEPSVFERLTGSSSSRPLPVHSPLEGENQSNRGGDSCLISAPNTAGGYSCEYSLTQCPASTLSGPWGHEPLQKMSVYLTASQISKLNDLVASYVVPLVTM